MINFLIMVSGIFIRCMIIYICEKLQISGVIIAGKIGKTVTAKANILTSRVHYANDR